MLVVLLYLFLFNIVNGVCAQVGDQKKYTSVKESTNCLYYNEVKSAFIVVVYNVDVVNDVVVVVVVGCVQVGDQNKYTSVKERTNCPYYNEVAIHLL
jgi:hypothetical protein